MVVINVDDLVTAEPEEVVEVKHGKWIYISPAEDWIMSLHQCNQRGHINEGKTAYFPNCGADMRGEGDE